ncbi:hypothetical protein Tco_0182254 [Tanacetum coccineum]
MDALPKGAPASVGLVGSGRGDIGNDDTGSGGDGIFGSGDEYDVSDDGGCDGNGNVAATAAISASVDAAIGGCGQTVICTPWVPV